VAKAEVTEVSVTTVVTGRLAETIAALGPTVARAVNSALIAATARATINAAEAGMATAATRPTSHESV
jgi:hypothetical protein